jgi:hypothetical protein
LYASELLQAITYQLSAGFVILVCMNWAGKRKFIYGAGVFLAIVLVAVYTFRETLFPAPSCFDTKQNGDESGIDCGGSCSLRCSSEILPLSVTWARGVSTSSTTYDFVALVSNKNIDNSPRSIGYTFTAYDSEGKIMVTSSGRTVAPVDGDFPVIVQNINLTQAPANVSATITTNVPHYKVLEKPTVPTIRISDTRYELGSIPRVYATLTSTKRIVLREIPVRVVLYDIDGNAFAVGQTVIPELGKEESKEIVFTWSRAFPFSPSKIRVFPILDPFLGSL